MTCVTLVSMLFLLLLLLGVMLASGVAQLRL